MDFLGDLLKPIQAIADTFASHQDKPVVQPSAAPRHTTPAHVAAQHSPRLPTRAAHQAYIGVESDQLPTAWLDSAKNSANNAKRSEYFDNHAAPEKFANKPDVWRQHDLAARLSHRQQRPQIGKFSDVMARNVPQLSHPIKHVPALVAAPEKISKQFAHRDEDELSGRSTPLQRSTGSREKEEDSWEIPATIPTVPQRAVSPTVVASPELRTHTHPSMPALQRPQQKATEMSPAPPRRQHMPADPSPAPQAKPSAPSPQPALVQVMYGAPQACSIVTFQPAAAPAQPAQAAPAAKAPNHIQQHSTTFVRLSQQCGTVQVHTPKACQRRVFAEPVGYA